VVRRMVEICGWRVVYDTVNEGRSNRGNDLQILNRNGYRGNTHEKLRGGLERDDTGESADNYSSFEGRTVFVYACIYTQLFWTSI